MASWRIRELGQTVQIGDIVKKPTSKQSKAGDCGKEEGDEHCDSSDGEVEFITDDTVSSYSIEDVLLPLPGWDVKLPNNRCT